MNQNKLQIKPEKMYAIWNKRFGFYIGTWLSRGEAISWHVRMRNPGATWDICKKRGDLCLRVEISAVAPRKKRKSPKGSV